MVGKNFHNNLFFHRVIIKSIDIHDIYSIIKIGEICEARVCMIMVIKAKVTCEVFLWTLIGVETKVAVFCCNKKFCRFQIAQINDADIILISSRREKTKNLIESVHETQK
jgi:hypothetical protein